MCGLWADVRVRRMALPPLRRARSHALERSSARSPAGLIGRLWARDRAIKKPMGFAIMLVCITAVGAAARWVLHRRV